MAFQNEEDYLDSLLKSIANGGETADLQESQNNLPQIDENDFVEVSPEEAGVHYVNQEQEVISNNAESWKDVVTVGDVLAHETDIASEFETAINKEAMQDDNDDEEVDRYIQNLLNKAEEDDNDIVPSDDTNKDSLYDDYEKALQNLKMSVDDLQPDNKEQINDTDISENAEQAGNTIITENAEQAGNTDITENAEQTGNTIITENSEETNDTDTTENEEQTNYIDITENESGEFNDLLGMIDGIISDVEQETETEAQNNSESGQDVSDSNVEPEVNFSDLNVDDELKELLGGDEALKAPVDAADDIHLSEEELNKLAEIQAQSDAQEDTADNAGNQISSFDAEQQLQEDDDDLGLAQLMNEIAAAGVELDENTNEDSSDDILNMGLGVADTDDNVAGSSFTEPADGAEGVANGAKADGLSAMEGDGPQEKSPENGGKKAPKESFISKLLAIFKKNKVEPAEEDNENQQVLDELFDENGELKAKEKKVKKKGLFSKSPKQTDAVETPIEGLEENEGLQDIPEGKPKKKKEKKPPKEKKPKKAKKPKKEKKPKNKKPKVKKEKLPVNPNEIIHVKPASIIIMIVIVALISGGAYLSVKSFIYEQAYDNATFCMLNKEYSYAYEEICGVTPKTAEDEIFYEQVQVIMYLQKEYNSYENYFKMGLHFEAIDSLIKGLLAYDEYYQKASELGVTVDFNSVKSMLVSTLEEKYGITESMARSYAAITDYGQYVYILESYGGKYQ